jgi:uncharacterized protein YyaL (SSP411 family)
MNGRNMKNYTLFFALIVLFACGCDRKKSNTLHSGQKANRLINESSPYLLQHAYNPVDWYPWGEEALEKAQQEDKLLIISVGYAACHWCHVMEHESFEDSTVAEIMNTHFVPIKVDREERPDVDDVYMTAAQLISGRGGWPLNAIALPDGRPLYAGTYYPKEQWLKILEQFIKIKKDDPNKLNESAQQLTEGIVESNLIAVNANPFSAKKTDMESIVKRCLPKYDAEYGGRTGAPKFPMPNSYEFLMKYHWLTDDEAALTTTLIALDKMAMGGIYDHLGGGFARYSTDAKWLVPHFEKMLYDNGQLVSIYAQAYKLTKNPLYKNVVTETIEFVERELMSQQSGFYSSLDADSEGEEGKFYVWTEEEIASLITNEKHRNIFKDYYDVSKSGNWEHVTILNQVQSVETLAKKYSVGPEEITKILKEGKKVLFDNRAKRERPGTDDKILTSWNALMLAGYLDAYDALGQQSYLDRALSNANFILTNQINKDGQVLRNHKNGKASINGFLDDYALTIHAFLKLYQATLEHKWIEQAELLAGYCVEQFYNNETKMFDYTSKLDPPLVAKKAEYNDNVIPASNSSMARSLFTLGTLTYNKDYLEKSEQMLNNMLPQLLEAEYLSFHSNWLQLLLDKIYSPYEIAIVGKDAISKRDELAANYLGNALFLGTTKEENLALLKDKTIEDATMIYVCQNKVCKIPVEDAKAALALAQPTK